MDFNVGKKVGGICSWEFMRFESFLVSLYDGESDFGWNVC